MEQEKLERKVREIFEQQDFKVEKDGNRMKASNGNEMAIAVYSSGKYSDEEVEVDVGDDELVFVDEDLSDVQDRVDNRVSIIKPEQDEDHDLPSYEIIGDIAVINELVDHTGEEAAKAILQHHPRIKTILLKKEGLQGEFRVGEYDKLYGDETETVHKEFGCRFKVDPTKVYFSERFGTERDRVVSQIEPGERVLGMFAGIGPFAVLAAKNADPEKVVGVEKNPEAAEYMRQNIELNSVEDTVEVHEGDVEDIVPDLGAFDRIVMPLPETADEFLELAMEHTVENGVIHYYRFLEDENWEEVEDEVEAAAEKVGREFEIVGRTVCGHKGPGIDRVCLDIKLG